MLSHREIKTLLPHRHPMLLVDAVTELELGASIVAIKNITGNEPCYAGLDSNAGPCNMSYPCTLIVESFCQAAGVLYSKTQRESGRVMNGLMLFGGISKFRFYGDALPGDTLEHRVRLERGLADAGTFCGEVWAGGRKIADVERVLFAVRPAEVLSGIAAVAAA